MAHEKVVHELNQLYEEYTFCTAKDASLNDDMQTSVENDSLVYGEINLSGFCQLLQELCHSSDDAVDDGSDGGGIFYDLGSGSGRAVFAARFVGDYATCVGVELLPNLHQMAKSVQSLYKFQYRHKLQWQEVQFECSDLRHYDWSDGTVVYAPNLLFDQPLLDYITSTALQLKVGSYLISLKKLTFEPEDAFEMTHQRIVPMSWGESQVYVYRRQ
jgi:hypothetical protein